ncbi:hypothetical protein O5O45_18665 [Hahella aquimaris]|uniref:hypothetical protein n=1 Tax=Hahella sp. HNIBRBA332 TaxID=3015983 RepID=UPI00273AA437|nr:hypothetical protein [Hahella sp. HNIBRBA332]WLQ11754.1 hypothetical protein O5O45_18665 [Hahella sp. HNIBRBA332]
MKLMICGAWELLRALISYRQETDIALELMDADEGELNNAVATSLKSGRGQRHVSKSAEPAADLKCKQRPLRQRLRIRLVRFSLCAGVSRAEQGVNELSRAQNTLSDYLSGL